MVVNKGGYGYYVIQSSNQNQIEAYGSKRQKRMENFNICVDIE